MIFNRTEHFRHAFGKPPEIKLEFNGDSVNTMYGLLLDISPAGARVFADNKIPVDAKLNISFAIAHERIHAESAIIWAQEAAGGWIYGLHLTRNAVREMFIADEVKALKEKK